MPTKPKTAKEKIAAAAEAPTPAPDMTLGDDGQGEGYDASPLGNDCPVQALGYLAQRQYFLDHAHQLIELGTEFRKGEVMALFGNYMRWIEKKWPVWKVVKDRATGEERSEIVGFDQKEAQRALIAACARAGLFDPTGKVRGRGAHLGPDGELVLHCGHQVLIGPRRGVRGTQPTTMARPGLIGGTVYPAGDAIDLPGSEAAPAHVAHQVLALLRTWNWKQGGIEPHILLCWIAAAIVGGALTWRPHLWITGPSGAGKSSLQRLIAKLLAGWAIRTEDATEAGVRQLLHQDTLAVCFDEIEPDEGDGSVHQRIVKLARLASSGGSALRGSQDHKSKQFVAKSCFLFSSIHHHELAQQDRNRIAILHLAAFPTGTPPLLLPETLAEWGAKLRRRLLEQWPRFDATLDAYQREMLRQGYSGREQDQYGTLLACGDLLLEDAAPADAMAAALNQEPDRVAQLVDQLAKMLDASRADGETTDDRCLKYLTSRRLPSPGGRDQLPVSEWIADAIRQAVNEPEAEQTAQRKLQAHGMAVTALKPGHAEGNGQGGFIKLYAGNLLDGYLAVANKSHHGVVELFEGSQWRGGVWAQALGLVDGAHGNKKSRMGTGQNFQCVVVPLKHVVDMDALLAAFKAAGRQIG